MWLTNLGFALQAMDRTAEAAEAFEAAARLDPTLHHAPDVLRGRTRPDAGQVMVAAMGVLILIYAAKEGAWGLLVVGLLFAVGIATVVLRRRRELRGRRR